jgi:hypothetical protein
MKNLMEKLRQWVAASSLSMVSLPYLPSNLIWSALLLAYTDVMVFLLAQPGGYWLDRSRAASSFPFLERVLSAGLLSYALVSLIYLMFFGILLTVLTRSFALVVWLSFSFVHLTHIFFWVVTKVRFVDTPHGNPVWSVIINTISVMTLGILLVRGLLVQPGRSAPELSLWQRRLKPIAVGGWVFLLIVAVSASAIWPRGGWVRLHPDHMPGRRGNAAIAYDPVAKKVILFGGLSDWLGSSFQHANDTWEWDGQDWTKLKPNTIPPARSSHMMAYDEKRQVVVMFGGEEQTGTYMLNDTWEWDGQDWKQIFPDNYPLGRRGGQMFYDHESGRIILLGGFYYAPPDKVFTHLNDVWAWNGINWQYVTTLPGSLLITNPNVAYDSQHQQTTLYDYKQLMTWHGVQWDAIEAGSQPPNRFGTWLAADPASGKMLLFGGVDNNVQRDDTWVWNGNTWKELHPDLSPSVRDGYVMFFDPSRNSFILYGGVSTYALDDMWEFVLP